MWDFSSTYCPRIVTGILCVRNRVSLLQGNIGSAKRLMYVSNIVCVPLPLKTFVIAPYTDY
jgi:hypothetical protein